MGNSTLARSTTAARAADGLRRYVGGRVVALAAFLLAATTAQAVEVNFRPVAPGIYAHIGETGGRTVENEGLNANLGLVVTPAGSVLIDSGATHRSARQIHAAIRRDADGYFVCQERGNCTEKVYFPYEDTALFVVDVALDADGNLHAQERYLIETLVKRFKHHKNIIWAPEESCNKLSRAKQQRLKKVAALVAQTDNFHHPIASMFQILYYDEVHPDKVGPEDYVNDPNFTIMTWGHYATPKKGLPQKDALARLLPMRGHHARENRPYGSGPGPV